MKEKVLTKSEYASLLSSIPSEQRVTSYEYANKGITALVHNGVTYVLGE